MHPAPPHPYTPEAAVLVIEPRAFPLTYYLQPFAFDAESCYIHQAGLKLVILLHPARRVLELQAEAPMPGIWLSFLGNAHSHLMRGARLMVESDPA